MSEQAIVDGINALRHRILSMESRSITPVEMLAIGQTFFEVHRGMIHGEYFDDFCAEWTAFVAEWLEGSTDVFEITDELPREGEWDEQDIDDIDVIILHHTDTGNENEPHQIARMHIDRGSVTVPYHFIVYEDIVYQCNDLWRICWSEDAVSIALAGNFDLHEPSEQQLQRARVLIDAISDLVGKELELVLESDLDHETTSPGLTASQWIHQLRREL